MADTAVTPPAGRRTFGPVVLLGLSSAALVAVASAKPWIGQDSTAGNSDASMAALDSGTRYPVASAISLVLLAAWGVLLVTRGRVRRGFALLTAVAALALLVSVVVGYLTLPDTAQGSFDELMGRRSAETGFTGWFWTAAACALVSVVPAGLAVRLVGEWPEMGSRYDAPGSPTAATEMTTADPERDLWHAQDEGRDPTDSSGRLPGA